MNAPELFQRLQSLGTSVAVVGDELEIEAPACVLTPKVLCAVKAHKREIMALLESAGAAPDAQSTLRAAPPLELPPALLEMPDLELGDDSLWRWRGFIVPTKGTAPAYAKFSK